MSAPLLVLSFVAGLAIVGVTAADVVGTLVVTGTAGVSRPARLYYRYTWAAWRGVGRRIADERQRERWLAIFGPLSMLSLLLLWLMALAVGWALIYQGLLHQVHGTSDFVSLLYYSSATLLTPSFGEVTPDTAWAGILTLVETIMGFGSIALLISYLPVLYGAYNRREARLLTLDDPLGERISPGRVIIVHALDGDLQGLYQFFAEWELWTAEILESHVSYPMLAYFRSQHMGQSWITALGVVVDAAVLAAALVPGANARQPYFMYRRGRRAIVEIGRRLQVGEGKDFLNRELFAIAYARLGEAGLPLVDFETAWQRLETMRTTYGRTLQGLIDYLLAPAGLLGPLGRPELVNMHDAEREAAQIEIGWRIAPVDDPGLPAFIARGALPDPATARCELCDTRPKQPLSSVLVVDGPDGLPVPFLICATCRRTLYQLHAMLETARKSAE